MSLRSARLSSGLSLKEAAAAFDVTVQAVSLWETEKTMPKVSLLPKIAEVYGVTIEELIRKD